MPLCVWRSKLRVLKKISNEIYRITGIGITLMLAVIVILSFVQVISRFIFKFSIAWSQELIVYLLIWLVFLGCSMGIKNGEVASLSLLTERLELKPRKIVSILINLALLLFFVITFFTAVELAKFAYLRKSSIMHINMVFVSAAYLVSALIMAYNSFIFIIDDSIQLFKLTKEES